MRKVELKIDTDINTSFSRVNIESLDFDWLFDGKNCQSFLELLVG